MSTGGILIRFLAGLGAGVAAVALAATLTTTRAEAHRGGALAAGVAHGAWANTAELVWLHKLGLWENAVTPANCSRGLTTVGAPPTSRLVAAFSTMTRACAQFANGSATTAIALMERADEALPPGEQRGLPVVAGTTDASHVDPRFNSIASALAGKDVEVRCWSRSDWTRLMREERAYTLHRIGAEGTLGFAGVGGTRENLSPEVCANLEALAYERRVPSDYELAAAVVTLTHEPQHSKGIANEARAECNAIQLMKQTAEKLGAGTALAAALQRLYWSQYANELPAYRSPQCRAGGAFDLDPATPSFP